MTRWFVVAHAFFSPLPALIYPLLMALVRVDGPPHLAVLLPTAWVVLAAVEVVFGRRRWRSDVLASNGFAPDGRSLPPSEMGNSWTKAALPNIWVVPTLASFAVVGGVLAPIVWGSDPRFEDLGSGGPTVLTVLIVGSAVAFGAGIVARIVRTRREPSEAWWPGASTTWMVWCASVSCGGLVAYGLSWAVPIAGTRWGVQFIASVALPAVAALTALVALLRERRIGRRIGAWDLRPIWAPQEVARPLTQLPPPPGSGRPAVG